jgi:hypothetical protein
MLDINEASAGEAGASFAHSEPALEEKPKSLGHLKIICWVLLIGAGIVQAWYTRHRIFSDGISYIEIAHYYTAGNWKAALNSYWSPLYSWILAFWLFVLRPSAYWEAGLLHLTNFIAYVASLVGFELFLASLTKLQHRLIGETGLSEATLRIAGYSAFLVGTLAAVTMGYVSPDMLGTAIGLFLAAMLLRIALGDARLSTYIWFGVLLGLEYLARAAFAVYIPLYLAIAAVVLYGRSRRLESVNPILASAAAALVVALPFVTALSVSKGRFTLGDAGKLNYGWEVDGAARSIHWQGEPGDIGKPLHPTHKVFDHPAVYTFASPVAGSYPPWFDPSYWYAGISPRLKIAPQLYVFKRGLKGAIYLFLRSPIVLPAFVLIFFAGWRRWLSKRGILAYWFLLLPSIAYIGAYTLVYLDPRYVAGSLLVIWMCILPSLSLRNAALRNRANQVIQFLSLLTAVVFLGSHLLHPTIHALDDLLHLREGEGNLNAMVAERMKEVGLHPGSRIAWIGESINSDWARLDGAKIVAEVPVRYDRQEELLFRWVEANRSEVKSFWYAPPAIKAHVLDLFRKEGVTFVMTDKIPDGVDRTGWHQVLSKSTPHLPWSGAQVESFEGIAYKRLSPG